MKRCGERGCCQTGRVCLQISILYCQCTWLGETETGPPFLSCRLRCSRVQTKQPVMGSAACTRGSTVLAEPTPSVAFRSGQSLCRLNMPPSTPRDVGLHSIMPKCKKEFCSRQSYICGTIGALLRTTCDSKRPYYCCLPKDCCCHVIMK